MSEDAQHRATEFLKELYAAGQIDERRLDTGVAELLAARTDAELAEVLRSLPPPVALTSPDRRLDQPLEIHSGMRRLRLTGRWQVARETHVSADLGSVRIDLTEAEFDNRVIDLHVYTGWGASRSSCPGASGSRSSATTAGWTRGWNRRCRAPACPARRDHQHRQGPPPPSRAAGPQETRARRHHAPTARPACHCGHRIRRVLGLEPPGRVPRR
jgi:hypothetical protein